MMLGPVRSVALSGSDKHDMYQIIIVDNMWKEEYDSRFLEENVVLYSHAFLQCYYISMSFENLIYEHFCYACYGLCK